MTITVKSAENDRYYIEIERNHITEGFTVAAYEKQSENMCGYPFTEIYYPTIKDANARFNRLKRQLGI